MEALMRRAVALGERGRGNTGTNPLVGAVVTLGEKIIAEGWYAESGAPHAEAMALARAGVRSRGATLFVTVEPCATVGKTPPCTRAIISAGVRRVVVGMPDPSQRGAGSRELKRAGVNVVPGILRCVVEAQNREFLLRFRQKRPMVTLKLAISIDGRIADGRGFSKWITGPDARRWSRALRSRHDAVMVGAHTVRLDDPGLASSDRMSRKFKIVVSGSGNVPSGARLFRSGRAIVCVSKAAGRRNLTSLESGGAEVMRLPARGGGIDLGRMLRGLYAKGIGSVLCEGGAGLAGALLDAGLVDKAVFVIAPRILGGMKALPAIGGEGRSLRASPFLKDLEMKALGADIAISGWLRAGR